MSKPVVLLIIVVSQFLCTSLWFAGNAVIEELARDYPLKAWGLSAITSSVQLGFISGTLTFAVLTISDRFSPVRVFFLSSLLAACFNIAVVFSERTIVILLALRFLTGFFLAGIYPVGMKIASDHFDNKLGKALGFLVGALVVGTALPHLIKSLSLQLPWITVFKATSLLALTGGSLLFFLVPNGPFRKISRGFDSGAISRVFRNKELRSAAFGYFGHMWELYTFWAFVPAIIAAYIAFNNSVSLNVSLMSFIIIACGGIACVASGFLSRLYGCRKTALGALISSAICCLLAPLSFYFPLPLFIGYLVFWGLVVVADSPMFSTMVASAAPTEFKGTALTLVNSIGFAITILSIALIGNLTETIKLQYLLPLLSPGPAWGVYSMRRPHITENR